MMMPYRLTLWFDGVCDFVTVWSDSSHGAVHEYQGAGEVIACELI